LPRTAARTVRQPRRRKSTSPTNPHAHTAAIAIAVHSTPFLGTGATAKLAGNGSLISTTVLDTAERAMFLAGAHSTRLPSAVSRAKGSRNFSDALSQIQKRTPAEFRRSPSANKAAAPANSVDCQR